MIKFCSMCSGLTKEDLIQILPQEFFEDDCIDECGSEFTAYVGDDLITASSKEDFFKQIIENYSL